MQYTGLKDKNGKEIYEGDIIRNMVTNGYQIFRVSDWFRCFLIKEVGSNLPMSRLAEFTLTPYFRDSMFKNIEVIGNIYENPELWRLQNDKRTEI